MKSQNTKEKIVKTALTAMLIAIAPLAITSCALNPETEAIEIQASNNLPMNINSNRPMIVKLTPEGADTDKVKFVSSDEGVVTVSNEEGGAVITSHDVGAASIYAIAENGVQSNSVEIKVINELEERKKAQERKEQQWQAAQATLETKEAIPAQGSTAAHTKPTTNTISSAVYESTGQEYKEGYVYIPRTGRRYHKDFRCSGMKEPGYVSVSTAKKRGFTPCKKCYGYY